MTDYNKYDVLELKTYFHMPEDMIEEKGYFMGDDYYYLTSDVQEVMEKDYVYKRDTTELFKAWFKSFFGCCVLLTLCGCAVSTQQFVDRSYSDEGVIIRETTGKSRTVSPPLKSAQSLADHTLEMTETDDGWTVVMGSKNDLTGGDLERFVSIIGGM